VNTKYLSWVLFPALVWSLAPTAQAESRKGYIDFETDCSTPTPVDLTGNFDLFGYKTVARNLYAGCGVSSITSGGSGSLGAQQLHNPFDPPFGPGTIPGQGPGQVVLSGALSASDGSLSFGALEVIFSPAVNEVTFDVLDLGNPSGLTITLQAAGGAVISGVTQPTVANGTAAFSHTSSTPIERAIISYTPSSIIDGWFVDTLTFNVWDCGDGDIDTKGGEACDDANGVNCDLCRNDCKKRTKVGCLDGNSCIEDGVDASGSFGCAVCDVSATPNDIGEILPTSAPTGQSCDDGLFCTDDLGCDGSGACANEAHDCDDQRACTVDSCNETDRCVNTVAVGCLIGGTCFANGEQNSQDPCEACDRAQDQNDWSKKTAGSTCGSPSCLGGVLTPAPLCDASGGCDQQTPVNCDGAVCADEQSCTGTCTDDGDCLSQNHCEDGTCKPDVDNGSPCTRAAECDSDFCADGVCCNAACDRVCESCNATGSVGTCTGAEPGTDPEKECPDAQLCAAPGVCSSEDRPNGAACEVDAVCKSGHCADGVCCNTACSGTCEACDVEASAGVCMAYAAGTDPANECGGDQVCSGGSSCVSYETRGNGLCSVQLGQRTTSLWLAGSLLGLLGLFLRRRRVR
jgi:hypothetical protein